MDKLRQIFKKMNEIDPSRELEGRILRSIALEKRLGMRKKMLLARGGLAVSFGAFFGAIFAFGKAFLESDFWNIAKLIFTDTGIVAGHLGEFSLSLLETLPAAYLAAILAPVFFLLLSANFYLRSENSLRIKTWT